MFGIGPGVGPRWQGGCVVMCGPTATLFTPLRPLHFSAGFRSQGLRQMTAMTAAPKKENASGQGGRRPPFVSSIRKSTAAERMPRFANRLDPDYVARFSTPAAQ